MKKNNSKTEKLDVRNIEIGTGATISVGSDRYPATVVGIRGKTIVQVQKDDYKMIKGSAFSNYQEYEYTPNPNASIREFSLRKGKYLVEIGGRLKDGPYLHVGYRDAYYDPHF